jgi:pyruvate,water dikinase
LLLGTRLCQAGKLARPDDILFLETTEIAGVTSIQTTSDHRTIIAQRREEYSKNLALTPPPGVIGRFDPNTPVVPVANANAHILQGIPVYLGIVTGLARVILRTDDHEQVLPGEILVAPFTDPAWTPYFVTAAGVVMDQGGILSHGSIVAREYGLSAVTNVVWATKRVRTGDRLQVNGNVGRVTILERARTGDTHRDPGARTTGQGNRVSCLVPRPDGPAWGHPL